MSFQPLLKALGRARVVVVGDLLADHYLFARTERVSREAPVLVVRHEGEEVRPGGAANVVANVAALGARVTAVGVVGLDAGGRALTGLLEATGAELHLVRSAAVPTETKTRVLAGGVSTTRQQMIRIDRGLEGPLPPKVQRALAGRLEGALAGAGALIVSDYGLGALCPQVREVVAAFARGGGTVCVDSRFDLGSYREMTVLKPNEPELGQWAGKALKTQEEVEGAAHRLRQEARARLVLVTRGHNGMVLAGPGVTTRALPVFGSGEAVDVTGAGDTVIAGLAAALATGASPLTAARLANVAGSIVVQKEGTAVASLAEVRAALGPRAR